MQLDNIPMRGEIKMTFHNVKTGKTRVYTTHNLITTAAKEALAAALRGDTANNRGIITYLALGSGTTAPALGDTQLEAESTRKLISVSTNSNNQAIFRTFFTTAQANGTHREAGLFGEDASGTADSGTLFARAAINRTKTSSETLTLEWTIIIG